MAITSIQFKRGSKAALEAYFVDSEHRLKNGEPAFEIDTGQLKIGNGNQNYVDLPYVGAGGGGEDDRFAIVDPVAGQILVYDDQIRKWVNHDVSTLTDDQTIVYLNSLGLSLKGYSTASEGQMPVKNAENGLSWITPVSTAILDEKVAAANQAKVAAQGFADVAGQQASLAMTAADHAEAYERSASRAVNSIPEKIEEKIQFMTIEEYNNLEEIKEDCFYFLTL